MKKTCCDSLRIDFANTVSSILIRLYSYTSLTPQSYRKLRVAMT